MNKVILKIAVILLILIESCSFFSLDKKESESYRSKEFSEIIENGVEATASEIEKLLATAVQFEKGNISIAQLQHQLTKTRNSFKKVEAVLAFYYPEHVKAYLNGAPLQHLDPFPMDENKKENSYYVMSPEAYRTSLPLDVLDTGHFRGKAKVVEPKGLQVLDELIFSENPEEEKEQILKLSQSLQQYFEPIKKAISHRVYFYDFEIAEAARLELIRIFSLGITGFDTPGSLHALEEAKHALLGTQALLTPITGKLPKEKSAEINKLFQESIRFIDKSKNFESFDRLAFLIHYMNPLYVSLWKAQQSLGIKSTASIYEETASWNAESTNIFAEDFLNPYYYSLLNQKEDSEELRKLGKKLFYEKQLSHAGKMSCASCHQPELAFTDGKKKSLSGINGKTVLRNSPTLINAVFADRYFYDLRAQDLEEQAEHVIENHLEFNTNFEEIMEKISQDKTYQKLFTLNFEEKQPLTRYNFAKALSSYVLSLRSFNSEFDQYVRGERKNISKQVKKGFNLFMGKANCATCHFPPTFSGLVPPLYRENESEVLGVLEEPDTYKIDKDLGRFNNRVFTEQQDIYKYSFKTTTVRNVAFTSPYFHNGAYPSLAEVIDFYDKGGAAGIGLSYELPQQTLPEDSLQLSHKEKDALIAFLNSLSDNPFQ